MTLNGGSRWWKGSKSNELRMYKESSFTLSAPNGNVITKIEIESNNPDNFTTTVGTYENGVWNGEANETTFNCTISKKNAPITKINVTYQESGAPVKKDPALSFSETAVTVSLGEAFTAPTLTKETDGVVTYSSDNEDVATVNSETGEVTIKATGKAKITASAAETENYSAGSAYYEITVTPKALSEVTLPYTESFANGIGSFIIEDKTLGEGLTYVWKHDANYQYMKASAYNKKNIASESWLVSPTIKMEGVESATLVFEQCVNKYFGNVEEEATLWVKEGESDWKQINITYPALKEGSNWSNFEEQTIDLSEYAGKNIKIGFKYTSTDNAAGTWEIKNISVTGVASGINGVKTEVGNNENAPMYNLAGQRVNKSFKGIVIQDGKKFVNNK